MDSQITVYMPVYNGSNYIKYAIESVLGQTFRDLTLFISDNNSVDDTIDVINSYVKQDNRIVLHKQKTNIGMIKNSNYCLDNIHSKYFLSLCHDDFLYSNRALELACNVLNGDDDIAVVYSGTLFIDQAGKPITRRNAKFSGSVENNLVAKRSIVLNRNLFGNIILARTEHVRSIRSSGEFYFAGDIEFSTLLGRNKKLYFIDDILFALRFHRHNNTARDFATLNDEFIRLADRYDIELSDIDKLAMKFNNYKNMFMKKLFYYYLDNFR